MLMSLQRKKIDWTRLEFCLNDLHNLSFHVQTIPPLMLDFSKVGAAVKSQVSHKTSEEIFNVLKSIYEYFNKLNLEEDIRDTS